MFIKTKKEKQTDHRALFQIKSYTAVNNGGTDTACALEFTPYLPTEVKAKSIMGDLIKFKGALKVCPQGGLVTFQYSV